MTGAGVIEPGASEAPGMEVPRVLGDLTSGRPGPTVVALGGIHGNEADGVLAAERVAQHLASSGASLRGRYLALAGNLGALRAGRRFLGCDLNRIWSHGPEAGEAAPEFDERDELLVVLQAAIDACEGDLVLLDLHSSSAVGGPFLFLSDTLRNRRLAEAVSVPVILGVEETIRGSLLEWLQTRGHACLAIEGGRHGDPRTILHHEAAIFSVLVAAGILDVTDVPELEGMRRVLEDAAAPGVGVVEVVHRHPIDAGDRFEMVPGFDNFVPVRAGQLLARDRSGELRCPLDGLLLLPLYQGQGDDGFFVGRRVRGIWLRLSALLRRAGLGGLVPILPGVRRDPARPGRVLIDRRVARVFPREVFHLLGYRLVADEGVAMTFERRPETPAEAALFGMAAPPGDFAAGREGR